MFNKTAGIIQGDSAVFQLSVSVPPGWVNFNVVLTGFAGDIFIENLSKKIIRKSLKISFHFKVFRVQIYPQSNFQYACYYLYRFIAFG